MNIISKLSDAFSNYLATTFSIDSKQAKQYQLELNVDEHKQQFGDLTSNAAMGLARALKRNPREIGQEIASGFTDPSIEKIEIAGPGFLNFTLNQNASDQLAQELLTQKADFFKPTEKPSKKINIEFVSANPTGPLHFGHGRGGIIGDVLGNVLSFLGNDVTKEFYINDAGAQIKKLGNSLRIRYQQVSGMKVDLPEDAYHGHYLIDLANELFSEHGDRLLDQTSEFFDSFAQARLLEHIKSTLADYGISFDTWFSEKTLHESGAIEQAIGLLEKNGLLYEKEGALWFTSTKYGDDKDRVLRKKDGQLTYAAADIAYMQDKVKRGADELIYILGHDHHSYATRLETIRQGLQLACALDVILYQLVSIKEDGQQLRMSKRAGVIVTLQDVIDTVGRDVARYFYLQRKADAQLEFDLNLALKHTDENPVYYIQYAYVRTGSILKNAEKEPALAGVSEMNIADLSSADKLLMKKCASLISVLKTIEHTHQTHLLAYYTHELAQFFNRYYTKNRVIDLENIPASKTRLALVTIMRNTLETCLDLLGLGKPTKM
jgi:arginyl-tRNA synthetase